jgi:hypothetical protein
MDGCPPSKPSVLFLWQCVYKARCAVWLGGSDTSMNEAGTTTWPVTDFLTSINLRDRFLDSSTDEDTAVYFPVGCFAPVTTVPPAMLREGPLHELAAAVHAMLRSPALTTPTAVRRTARSITAQPDRTRIRCSYRQGGFMISAWNKLGAYGATAYGGTRPTLVSAPFTCVSLTDLLGYVLPCPPAFQCVTTSSSASPIAGRELQETSLQARDGIVVYLTVDASLWTVLSFDKLLGEHLH